MFLAALTSRSRTNPQAGHRCVLSLSGFGTRAPYPEQVWLVFLGLTEGERSVDACRTDVTATRKNERLLRRFGDFREALTAFAGRGFVCLALSGAR